jgi:hypothetical protein
MNRVVVSGLVLVSVLLVPGVAQCEVMDKVPKIATFWGTALVGGGVGALLWRINRWAGLTSLVVSLIQFSHVLHQLRDRFLGPDIRQEAGPEYERNFWFALGTFVVLQTLGAFWWGVARRRRSKATVEQAIAPDGPAAGTS